MVTPPSAPKYLHHKASNRAFCKVAGRFIYLGKYGSPESHAAYANLVNDVLAGRSPTGRTGERLLAKSLTVRDLADRYQAHAKHYYTKRGKPTSEVSIIASACRRLVKQFGDLPADSFGPLALEAVRDSLVNEQLARSTVNAFLHRIRRVFKWGGAKELIRPASAQTLQLVEGVRVGRTSAKDLDPVQPVSNAVVERTLTHLNPVVGDMVRLQRLSGMRPGEVCSIRSIDTDRSQEVWIYRPELHKTAHHGRSRCVFLGPRSQQILGPYLERRPEGFCFCTNGRHVVGGNSVSFVRSTPNEQSPRGFVGDAGPSGTPYSPTSYRRAIHRACDRAGIPRWSPNRLRHAFATEVRAQHGVEAAQVALGHANVRTSELYAEKDTGVGARVAKSIG